MIKWIKEKIANIFGKGKDGFKSVLKNASKLAKAAYYGCIDFCKEIVDSVVSILDLSELEKAESYSEIAGITVKKAVAAIVAIAVLYGVFGLLIPMVFAVGIKVAFLLGVTAVVIGFAKFCVAAYKKAKELKPVAAEKTETKEPPAAAGSPA